MDLFVYLLKIVLAAVFVFLYITGFVALWHHDYMQAAAVFSFLSVTAPKHD